MARIKNIGRRNVRVGRGSKRQKQDTLLSASSWAATATATKRPVGRTSQPTVVTPAETAAPPRKGPNTIPSPGWVGKDQVRPVYMAPKAEKKTRRR